MTIAADAAPTLVDAPESDRAVVGLLVAIELRHPGTALHAERVADLALTLTAMTSPELAAAAELRSAFLLHDVGKIGVPDSVLLKPGPLTGEERRVVETHVCLGLQIVRRLGLCPLVRGVVGCHHERWDGRGYPKALRGPLIPLAARIFAIADAYDAMTNARPYREALSEEDAVAEIVRCAGSQFDPRIVMAFVEFRRANAAYQLPRQHHQPRGPFGPGMRPATARVGPGDQRSASFRPPGGDPSLGQRVATDLFGMS